MTKLIFCFDGTSNAPSDAAGHETPPDTAAPLRRDSFSPANAPRAAPDISVSNILKMHAFLGGGLKNRGAENPKTPGQRGFYYSGIGTYGGWVRQMRNALFAPIHEDLEDIINNAVKDLNDNFQEGDEVHIFGFSRGAAIARMFAAKINEHCERVKKVKFLGVFDTVAAIEGARDLREDTEPESVVLFENGILGAHVEKAVHLLAIDERRVMFQPTLFNEREGVEEIWFAGAHSDIGGGFWHDGLSDITLEFMLGRCEDAGLLRLSLAEINYDDFFLTDGEEKMSEDERLRPEHLEILPKSDGKLHKKHRFFISSALTLASRKVRVNVSDEISRGIPIVHHMVLERYRKVAIYRPSALRKLSVRVLQADGNLEPYNDIFTIKKPVKAKAKTTRSKPPSKGRKKRTGRRG